jgi:hypothetical protein
VSLPKVVPKKAIIVLCHVVWIAAVVRFVRIVVEVDCSNPDTCWLIIVRRHIRPEGSYVQSIRCHRKSITSLPFSMTPTKIVVMDQSNQLNPCSLQTTVLKVD